MVSLRKVFVKIEILFRIRIRIRIRIMLLLWISISRRTFHTWKTPTKFCLDPLTPSKVIVSTWKVHVRTYIQTDRPTDRQTDRRLEIFFCLFCLLKYKNHEYLSKGENIFFFRHSCDYNTFFVTYSVCDEKVKRESRVYKVILCIFLFHDPSNVY